MRGGVAILVLAACSTHPRISAETLRAQATQEEATLLKRVKVYDDPQLAEYLTKVTERVAAGAKVTVIADPTLGAFALPGGRVFVHTGLLSAVENEAQLAMILAREAAHDPSSLEPRRSKAPM